MMKSKLVLQQSTYLVPGKMDSQITYDSTCTFDEYDH